MYDHAPKVLMALCLCAMLSGASAALDPKVPLADAHQALEVTCENCHGTGPKKTVPMEKCLSCHVSYAKVAAQTAALEPNPHDNHLIDLECSKCHQGHKPLVNYCRTCHAGMEFKKP